MPTPPRPSARRPAPPATAPTAARRRAPWGAALTAAAAVLGALLGLDAAAARTEAASFSHDLVVQQARQAAQSPWLDWAQRDAPLPAALAALDYDGLRDIRFRPERALWRGLGLPFELQLFHRGGNQPQAVALHEVHEGRARPLAYDARDWDFGRHRLGPVADTARREGRDPAQWGQLGHAGFRVHHTLNTPAYKDELLVFLGASYFRALGRGQQYGLSARGLALDTVGGSAGEEFPRFTAFWIERPAPQAAELVVHALLESPRATGAYRFVVRPGEATTTDVQATLFVRAVPAVMGPAAVGLPPPPPLAMWGIAPLTSMYLHGENQPPRPGRAPDFRPEVHDSDGLLLAAVAPGAPGAATGPAAGPDQAAAEWLWRPLVNPREPLASSFAVQRLVGYGLMQRDRRFANYEDPEARYDRRPSAWVQPLGDWGPGRVLLLQLPTPDETEDNVVAAWVPATPPTPDQPLALSWRVHWQGSALQQPPAGWTVQSRRGHGWAQPQPGELQFLIDFDGPALRALPAGAPVVAQASAGAHGRVVDARAYPHPEGGWRLRLRVQRLDLSPTAPPLELRAFLQHGAQALTETWTALIPRD